MFSPELFDQLNAGDDDAGLRPPQEHRNAGHRKFAPDDRRCARDINLRLHAGLSK
jgi:hypothetical protein